MVIDYYVKLCILVLDGTTLGHSVGQSAPLHFDRTDIADKEVTYFFLSKLPETFPLTVVQTARMLCRNLVCLEGT